MSPQMLILPKSSPNKCRFYAKIQILLEIFRVKSDWTKPLRGSVALDLFIMHKWWDLSKDAEID
jgi:hypothetical protein